MLGGKFSAWWLAGSVSLLGDTAESFINVAAAVGLIAALRVARRPPDYEHPYGHQKAELLSSGFEALLIVVAGAMLLLVGFQRLMAPQPLQDVVSGTLAAAGAGALNLGLAWWLGRQARELGSEALRANSRHLFTDVWSSVGVIAAVLLVGVTGWLVLDAVVAIIVAVNILREGWQLLGRAVSQLLDERLPPETEQTIMAVLRGNSHVRGFHRLRSRKSGRDSFVEVDVFVDPDMTVRAAHAAVMELEDDMQEHVPGLNITVHVEPEEAGVREGNTEPRDEY